MTEQEVAELRARAQMHQWYEWESVVELCDALDACRATLRRVLSGEALWPARRATVAASW